MNSQFPITAVEASQVGDSFSLSEEFAEVTTINTSSTSTSSSAPVYNQIRQKPFDAEETTQSPVEIFISSSTSTSSDRRLDEFANLLDSCIEQLTPLAAQMESVEKATERASMLAKRMMETPLPDPPMMVPPMVEPPVVESDRASAIRRQRTRYTLLPGIMENAAHLAPNAWPPTRRA